MLESPSRSPYALSSATGVALNRVLLLNADWRPLTFVTVYRAVQLMFKERADTVPGSVTHVELRTPTQTFVVPSILRLRTYVRKRRLPPPRFRRSVLFQRDKWQCQYCGVQVVGQAASVEHILPLSRGGETTWMNCVTACKGCNGKKGNQTLEEAGMMLLSVPCVPKQQRFWKGHEDEEWDPSWDAYIHA